MTIVNAIFDFIKKHDIRLDEEITGSDKLDFETSAKWLHAAYLAVLDEIPDENLHKTFPLFVASYTPNENTMLLVDNENFVYYFEWDGDRTWPITYVLLERLEVN